MNRLSARILILSLFLNFAPMAWAGEAGWEYKVVVLQGLAAGGSFEKQASGVYTDTKRTKALNEMAADGWEVVAVIGVPGADHTVYLRRKSN